VVASLPMQLLFSLLVSSTSLTHPGCVEPEVWLDKSLSTVERGWATKAEKAETRARMKRTWKAMGLDSTARTVLDEIVVRESFAGDPCAVHVLGLNEYGLGPAGLFVRFQLPKWNADAPQWVLQIPEVSAVVMARILRRSLSYPASRTAKARTWLRFGQVFSGRVRAERQDYSKDSAWCSRLKGRGIECKDPVTKVGDKLGIGPTEGQIAFVVQLQEKISQ